MNESDLVNRMQAPARPDDEAVSPRRLANEWGVHINTVYRDIRKGALPAFRLPGGRFRIRRSVADRYGRPIE